MAINKDDPKYPEYIEECKRLDAEMRERFEQIRQQQIKEGYKGQDYGPDTLLHREELARMKELQKKYGFR